jgi:hypothetical protein
MAKPFNEYSDYQISFAKLEWPYDIKSGSRLAGCWHGSTSVIHAGEDDSNISETQRNVVVEANSIRHHHINAARTSG